MKVEVQLYQSSNAIPYDNAINCYTKGPMYCILFERDGERVTHKYPVVNIFRIIEDYGESKR
jgi:hypothetical protein